MKTKNSILLSLIAVAVMVSAAVFSTENATPVSKELTAFNDQYNAITAEYDIDAFLALYAIEPLWIAPGKAPVRGLEVPRATFDFFATNKGSLTHTLDHTYTSEDGTQAVMVGRYDLNVQSVGVKASGTYQFVLRKDGAQWKILTDMYNQHEAAK